MLPLEYITVGGLLRRTTALFPNRMAVIDREIRLTYREFDELTDRYATALLRQGVGRGDHVALFGESTPPWSGPTWRRCFGSEIRSSSVSALPIRRTGTWPRM